MKRAVTIKDIAEELNLSRNTVAKALNGQYVPEKTRALVLEKAAEMHYKSLNLHAEAISGPKYRILLVSSRPLNKIKYFVPFISAIEEFCFNRNHELFQYTFNNDGKPFSDLSAYVSKLGIDGIVAVECFNQEFNVKLLNLHKPVVFMDFASTRSAPIGNYDIISTDNFQAARGIAAALVRQYNISRFTFVGDIRHCKSFNDRYTGMVMGLYDTRTQHSPKEDILKDDSTFDYGSAESVKHEILKLKYSPQCFVCCNDFVGRTVSDALIALNISVPKDCLIVSFDNGPEAYSRQPKLTTFSVDKKVMGTQTIRTLIERIEAPATYMRNITISSKFIQRESTSR